MTFSDLCAEIINLGFETAITSSELVMQAAKRALDTILTERPIYMSYTVYQTAKKPSVRIKDFHHKGTYSDTFEFNAKSYSFRTYGEGKYYISDALGTRDFEFGKEESVHRGFLHGKGKLVFCGEYSHGVYDLCFFDELYGQNSEDIPLYSEFCEYDISFLAPNFLSFTSLPTDAKGNPIKDAVAVGTHLRVPSSFDGKIIVHYKRSAGKISEKSDEDIILPNGTEHLFPLLVASYVWLDDDAEKAEYYLSLYREGMSAAKYYNREKLGCTYDDVLGWA